MITRCNQLLKKAGIRLNLGRDAVSQPECGATLMRSMSPRNSWYSFNFEVAIRVWAEGAQNYGVLMKVTNDNVEAVDWRFWDRHDKKEGLRPYAMVHCLS